VTDVFGPKLYFIGIKGVLPLYNTLVCKPYVKLFGVVFFCSASVAFASVRVCVIPKDGNSPGPNSILCDVTPLAASSQGHGPDQGRECSGWFSQIGKRLHPLLFDYLIAVFFF